MVTRMYFDNTGSAPVSPAFTGWTNTASATRDVLQFVKNGAALSPSTGATGTYKTWTAGETCLDRQYVSAPIAAQTISGTVKCQALARESNADDNATSRMKVFVVSNDGSVVRGTLLTLGQYGPATEIQAQPSVARNKTWADGDAVSSVVCQAGDRIVVEIGYTDAAGTTPGAWHNTGCPSSATDAPENETSTGSTTFNSWIEFSADISLHIEIGSAIPSSASVVSGVAVAKEVTVIPDAAIPSSASVVGGINVVPTIEIGNAIPSSAAVVGGINVQKDATVVVGAAIPSSAVVAGNPTVVGSTSVAFNGILIDPEFLLSNNFIRHVADDYPGEYISLDFEDCPEC